MNKAHTGLTLARVLAAASLMLLASNLRPLFSSLSVLLPEVTDALDLSGATAGYLTTLPVLCLGLFAPLAPRLGKRIGTERTLFIALLMLAAGTGLRGADGLWALFLGTALAGAGIAIGNVLLPSIVKRDFAAQAHLMTGLYTMCLVGGAALAAAATLPLMRVLGKGWDLGLSIWAIPAALALLVWTPFALRGKPQGAHGRILPVSGLSRDRLAWAVTLFMGLQSSLAYCVMGWLAPILRARGMDGTEAGLVVSLSILIQVAACLLTPLLAARYKDQRGLCLTLTGMATVALLGLLLGPRWAIWPWAILQGVGQGGLFAIAMTIIVMRSPNSHVAAHLSGMAQTGGYLLAASGPLLIGMLHEWAGRFEPTGWLFAAVGLLTAWAGWHAGANRLVKARVAEA
ncbi:MAG TPA: MFS transporter [Castellaniella sp.]|nr:MFS transporter [Castellaniella sp.]